MTQIARHLSPAEVGISRPVGLRVSIIVPALNESAGIAGAIQRAWATGPDEVILVDGGSQDDTAERARAAGAQVLLAPRGRARQQNEGARRASGDVLLFLHADNWLAPDAVEQIRRALTDEDAAGGAFRQRIEAEGAAYRLLERGNAWRARRRGLPYGDQGIFVRRDLFFQLGGFPEVDLMEDLLFMKRFRRVARPLLLEGPLYVDPRRWARCGVVRQTGRNWLLLLAARLGVSPNRLARFYPPHIER